MTPRPLLWAAIVAAAVILAIVALLASGSFAPAALLGIHAQYAMASRSDEPRMARAALLAPRAQEARIIPRTIPSAGGVGTALLGGLATWYDTCSGCAAAGPELRAFLGDWRGQTIRVDGPGRAFVYVVLSDFCACGNRAGTPTLIDLSRQAFAELADPSAGIVAVSVEWPQTALPATDAVRSPADLRMFREVLDDEVYR